MASLTPWNFPISIQARKVAPALAAGCTVLARVSEKAPLAVTRWLGTLQEAGLPPGVLNVVHGSSRTITSTWLDHPAVRGVSFTGSTGVGSQIMAQAARQLRPMLELGGNAPFVVLEDADLEVALTQAGLDQAPQHRPVLHRSEPVPGAPLPGRGVRRPTRGPVRRVDHRSGDSRSGAGCRSGDRRESGDCGHRSGRGGRGGRWAAVDGPPRATRRGLLGGARTRRRRPAHLAAGEGEVFGPAAAIIAFDTEEEAVRLASDTEMGLAAYVVTRDAGRAFRFAERLDAGIVGINDALPTVSFTPMGGTKQSGLGREGGAEGLREYQETTYLAWRP